MFLIILSVVALADVVLISLNSNNNNNNGSSDIVFRINSVGTIRIHCIVLFTGRIYL